MRYENLFSFEESATIRPQAFGAGGGDADTPYSTTSGSSEAALSRISVASAT